MILHNLVDADPFTSIRQLIWRFEAHTKKRISSATVSRLLETWNLKCYVAKIKPFMSVKNA